MQRFGKIFIPRYLNSHPLSKLGCKPLLGGFNVQNIRHGPVHPAHFAASITLPSIMQPLVQLLPRWVAEGTEPLPPEPREAVKQIFSSLGSIATADVLSLYTTMGGMRGMDNEYWRLWPLDEIADQTPSEYGVVFSDYCISCWEYRLKPVTSSHSAVYVDHLNGSTPTMVAATLEEFFNSYVNSARALLDGGSLNSKGDA